MPLAPAAVKLLSTAPEALAAGPLAAIQAHWPAPYTAQSLAAPGSKLFFTAPEALVAGAPAVLYMNRARSGPLHDKPNVRVGGRVGGWVGRGCVGG